MTDNSKVSKHFSWKELACPTTNRCEMDPDFMVMLEDLRVRYGKPMRINSGFRSLEHNLKIGGSKASQHLLGKAVDISVISGAERFVIVKLAFEVGFTGIGIHSRFIHVDNRNTQPVVWLY